MSTDTRPVQNSLNEWIHQFQINEIDSPRLTNEVSTNITDVEKKPQHPSIRITSNIRVLQSKTHLIFCNKNTEMPSKHTISMTQDQYATVMEECHLPKEFIIDLLTRTPIFKQTEKARDPGFLKYIIRMPLSQTNNWTIAITWKESSRETFALLHGFSELKHQSLMDALQDFQNALMHPFLLPIVLCDLLTESDSSETKRHASELWSVELNTVPMRLNDTPKFNARADDDLSDLTRRVNAITSRLIFHEMRVKSCAKLVLAIIAQLGRYYNASKYDKAEPLVAEILKEVLQRLIVDHKTSLLEISCNQKIATSQLQILYNLIAQRDNRNNLDMAATSTKIAQITQEDSFAMRTIAVMTIAFLPATAISSILSMSMFNWLPDDGKKPVVSPYLWIYWLVAVLLPLVVIGT